MRPGFGALGSGSTSPPVLDRADLAFEVDASNPATSTDSAGTLTSLISTVSGTPLSVITGAPKKIIDPRINKPAFSAAAVDGVRGSDAVMQAAATGTNRPFTEAAVFEVTSCTSTGYWFSCNLSSGTDGLYFGQVTPNIRVSLDGSVGGFLSGILDKCVAGLNVVVIRTPDGQTFYISVNGGAETSVTVASHGLMSPDRTGIFQSVGLTPGGGFNGCLYENLFYGVDKGAVGAAGISAYLLTKWRPAPVFYPIGDSLSSATLVNNGGMVGLLMAALRADGLNADPQGPTAQANGSGGAVWYPYRHSASSGNTCAQMLARVQSPTQGLGVGAQVVGGTSEGFFRRARLGMLLAGTNDRSLPGYDALLREICLRGMQHPASFAVSLTPIPEIDGLESEVAAFNAGLPALWNAVAVDYPGVTQLRWNANALSGTRPDGTHWNDADYVNAVMDPTNGLYQAVKPWLTSVQ